MLDWRARGRGFRRQSAIHNPKSQIASGSEQMEQVSILVAAIGSMFALIALVIWLAWLSARRDSEDSA